MLRFTEWSRPRRLTQPRAGALTLRFEDRAASRHARAWTMGGEAALLICRAGRVLRDGDRLRARRRRGGDSARRRETCRWSRARPPDLARAAYHLGNRHVPVQIGAGGSLRARPRPRRHGRGHGRWRSTREAAPFEPEAGAYGRGVRHGRTAHPHRHACH